MKILILGDVMGNSGRKAVKNNLSKLIKDESIDFTIINLGTANADEIITLAAGTGGTLVGSGAVLTPNAQDNEFSSGSGLFRVRFTGVASGSEAIVIYRLA